MELVTEEPRELLIERGRVGDREELPDLPPVVKLHTPAAGATWLIATIDPNDLHAEMIHGAWLKRGAVRSNACLQAS